MYKNIKISIVVACYNVENYVFQCIDSLVKQSYTNIEIIIINDESKDRTLSIIESFSSNDERIILVNQKNKGLSGVRNEGMKIVSGDYIMFVDGDDWLDADCVSILVDNLQNQDMICCSYNRVFNEKILKRTLNLNGNFSANHIQRRITGLINEELQDPSQADSLVTAWGKLYKKDIIKEHGIVFVDTKIIGTEDALFNIYYLEYAKNVCVVDVPLYFYRKYNVNSLTSTYKSNLFNQWQKLYDLIHEKIQSKGNEFVEAYNNRICLSIIGLGLNELLDKKGFYNKYKNLKSILKSERYRIAYSNLELKKFPLHWKLFFFFAKYRLIVPLLLMLMSIKKIISK